MSGCGGKERFHLHTAKSWRQSLAARLVRMEDRSRDVEAKLGFRPYVVSIVHTRWSGSRRGDGVQEVVAQFDILPVPKITDLTGLTNLVTPSQVIESGQVVVREISGRYTEDQLETRTSGGEPHAPMDDVFWEITFLAGCGEGAGTRRRFNARSAPFYDAERVQWVVTLVKAQENRARNGSLR